MASPASRYPTPLEVSAHACDALNGHDLRQLRSVLAEDVVAHVVPSGRYDGREAVLAYHERIFAAAPALHVDVVRVAVAEDAVFTAWELRATFTGAPFAGLRANGRRVKLQGVSTQVVHEGQVASAEVIFDGASLARQVGVLPTRGSSAERALLAACNLRTRVRGRQGPTATGEPPVRSPGAGDDAPERPPRGAVGPRDLEDLLQRDELAVIATDRAGVGTHWSAGAARLYGWSGAEVLGRSITDLTVGPEDEEGAENIMRSVRERGRWEGEFWVHRKDGGAFLAYVREAIV